MPAFRNIKTRRSSGRIWNKTAIAYDEKGWEIPPHANILLNIPTRNDIPSPHSSATSPSIASVDSDFENYPARKSKGKAKAVHTSDSDYVPRPKNAFILFRSYFYQTCGGSDQNQISVDAGKAWKALPDEQKKPFQLAADREKQEHQAKFPHYTYSPGSKLGAARRKNSVTRKKKTPPSAKKSLVIPPPAHRDSRLSRVKVEPLPVTIPPPALLSLAPPSPIVPHVEKLAVELANSHAVPQSDSVFCAHWSFETAFVPTSEIPPLELSPVKSEKEGNKGMKGLKPPSSLRPPNFDISNEPFCLNPQLVTIGSYLDTSLPNSHYDYNNETLEQLPNSSNFYALTTLSSEFETRNLNNSSYFGPLELSYVGYPIIPEVTNDDWELDFSAMDTDLAMGYDTNSKPSFLPPLAAGLSGTSVKPLSSFDDFEMDQYVDYGECDA